VSETIWWIGYRTDNGAIIHTGHCRPEDLPSPNLDMIAGATSMTPPLDQLTFEEDPQLTSSSHVDPSTKTLVQ
jgi:hypothetical protein